MAGTVKAFAFRAATRLAEPVHGEALDADGTTAGDVLHLELTEASPTRVVISMPRTGQSCTGGCRKRASTVEPRLHAWLQHLALWRE